MHAWLSAERELPHSSEKMKTGRNSFRLYIHLLSLISLPLLPGTVLSASP